MLTLDDVARYPRPGTAVPGRLSFSPDGKLLCYLKSASGGLGRELFCYDLESKQTRLLVSMADVGMAGDRSPLSPEEQLRRERERLRETGITHYSWATEAPVMLLSGSGSLYIHRNGKTLPSIKNAIEARLSTDGRKIVFVRAGDLYVATVDDGTERRLTYDATEGVRNGLAEYIAQEEMHRMEGFWISPDAHAVAYTQVDDRHIPELQIPLLAKAPGAFEGHRYPFTGAANARVRLGVVGLEGGETRWLDLGNPEYIARVTWDREGRLLVQTQPRDQRLLQLWRVNAGTGEKTLLLEERSESWVNLHDDLRPLRGGAFLWTSERSGYKHIYLYNQDGSLKKQLTAGDWAVDRILATPADSQVYFSAGNPDPRQRQLFSVSLDDATLGRLSQSPGMHDGVFHRSGKLYLDIFESRSSPPSVILRHIDGTEVTTIQAPAPVSSLPTPELITVPGVDGTPLYGALFRPKGATGPRPLLVAVYGGPHAQTVTDSWALTVDMRAQYLAEQGFVVLKLDNRGMARRGTRFENALYRKMGTVEVEDQVRGVQFLVESGIADPKRVGVYGWSYGGYMALLCLAKAPEVFRAAVAGAPVTEWEGYDTHYTERYMATPAENPDGYRESSVLNVASQIRGKLMVVHGLIDENVHFRHSARLMDLLVKAGIEHELLLFPDERHMPRGQKDMRMMEERISLFLQKHLA